jgi:hypothetical protein
MKGTRVKRVECPQKRDHLNFAERFGTTTNLYHHHAYNNRFQMIETRLGTSSTDSQSCDRGALIFYYSNKARTAYQPFSSQDDNNGNVSRGITCR